MIDLCCQIDARFALKDYADVAQLIIATVNLFLAAYVIFYQIKKDKKTENETARLNEQNIKLQWFKELIVQPNMINIEEFYSNLHSIKRRINSNDLSTEQKEDINAFIKAELSKIRKSFIDVLKFTDKTFADQLMDNLDKLIDGITNSIFNDELKLNNPNVYEKEIGTKISYSKSYLISQLYNYKGIALHI